MQQQEQQGHKLTKLITGVIKFHIIMIYGIITKKDEIIFSLLVFIYLKIIVLNYNHIPLDLKKAKF